MERKGTMRRKVVSENSNQARYGAELTRSIEAAIKKSHPDSKRINYGVMIENWKRQECNYEGFWVQDGRPLVDSLVQFIDENYTKGTGLSALKVENEKDITATFGTVGSDLLRRKLSLFLLLEKDMKIVSKFNLLRWSAIFGWTDVTKLLVKGPDCPTTCSRSGGGTAVILRHHLSKVEEQLIVFRLAAHFGKLNFIGSLVAAKYFTREFLEQFGQLTDRCVFHLNPTATDRQLKPHGVNTRTEVFSHAIKLGTTKQLLEILEKITDTCGQLKPGKDDILRESQLLHGPDQEKLAIVKNACGNDPASERAGHFLAFAILNKVNGVIPELVSWIASADKGKKILSKSHNLHLSKESPNQLKWPDALKDAHQDYSYPMTFLQLAAAAGHKKAVDALIETGKCDPNACDLKKEIRDWIAFVCRFAQKETDEAQSRIDARKSSDWRKRAGLHINRWNKVDKGIMEKWKQPADEKDEKQLVELYVDQMSEVDAEFTQHRPLGPAICVAIAEGDLSTTKQLIKHGADPFDITLLDEALRNHHDYHGLRYANAELKGISMTASPDKSFTQDLWDWQKLQQAGNALFPPYAFQAFRLVPFFQSLDSPNDKIYPYLASLLDKPDPAKPPKENFWPYFTNLAPRWLSVCLSAPGDKESGKDIAVDLVSRFPKTTDLGYLQDAISNERPEIAHLLVEKIRPILGVDDLDALIEEKLKDQLKMRKPSGLDYLLLCTNADAVEFYHTELHDRSSLGHGEHIVQYVSTVWMNDRPHQLVNPDRGETLDTFTHQPALPDRIPNCMMYFMFVMKHFPKTATALLDSCVIPVWESEEQIEDGETPKLIHVSFAPFRGATEHIDPLTKRRLMGLVLKMIAERGFLMHPAVMCYIKRRWLRGLCWYYCYVNILIIFVFNALFTAAMYAWSSGLFYYPLFPIIFALAGWQLFMEGCQLVANPSAYASGLWENFGQVASITGAVLSTVYCWLNMYKYYPTGVSGVDSWHAANGGERCPPVGGAASCHDGDGALLTERKLEFIHRFCPVAFPVLVCWLMLMTRLRIITGIGLFVESLIRSTLNFGRVIFALFFMFVAFVFAFAILHQKEMQEYDVTPVEESFLDVVIFFLGGVEKDVNFYAGGFPDSENPGLWLYFYCKNALLMAAILLLTIMSMNLIMGVVLADVLELMKQAEERNLQQKALLLYEVDNLIYVWRRMCCGGRLVGSKSKVHNPEDEFLRFDARVYLSNEGGDGGGGFLERLRQANGPELFGMLGAKLRGDTAAYLSYPALCDALNEIVERRMEEYRHRNGGGGGAEEK